MEAEVFKLTIKPRTGEPMVMFVLPGYKHHMVKTMREEYGDVEVTPMMMSDLPEGVSFPADTDQ